MKKEKSSNDFAPRAYYPGGKSALNKFVQENLQYPEEALQNKIEGSVLVKFDVDYQGMPHHMKVITPLGYGCDEEAVRIISLLTFKVPKTRKIKVVYHKKLTIHFNLPQQTKSKKQPEKVSVNYQYTLVSSKPRKKTNEPSVIHYTIKFQQ